MKLLYQLTSFKRSFTTLIWIAICCLTFLLFNVYYVKREEKYVRDAIGKIQAKLQTETPLNDCNATLNWSENGTHPQKLAAKLRAYVNMSNVIELCGKYRVQGDQWYTLLRKHLLLENELFPFLQVQGATQIKQSFKGRGIAVAASSGHLRFLNVLLHNLRLLGCKLPVEVFYKGNELSDNEKQYLIKLGVRPVDILSVTDDKEAQASGFAVKLFAVFFSSFRETMLVDADSHFFHNPELLFDDPDYKNTGTLYYLDRYWHEGETTSAGPTWFDKNMPQPLSAHMKTLQMYRGLSNNQLEAGVVLMDKYRNFHGILAACRLQMKVERDAWFDKAFWGDKEAFWIAFELLGQDYSIHPWRPGNLGRSQPNPKTSQQEVCGNVMHPGRDGRPFWWNGGVIAKFLGSDDCQNFDSFSVELDRDTGRKAGSCLEEIPPTFLNERELNITRTLCSCWRQSVKVLEQVRSGNSVTLSC